MYKIPPLPPLQDIPLKNNEISVMGVYKLKREITVCTIQNVSVVVVIFYCSPVRAKGRVI